MRGLLASSGGLGGLRRAFPMNEAISRRKLLFLAGLAASIVVPTTVLIASNAEAQQTEQTLLLGRLLQRRKRKRKRRRRPQAPERPLRQSNRRHSSHRRHQDRRVTSQVRGHHRLRPHKSSHVYFVIQCSLRAWLISQPMISALCLVEPPRPERPSCPESISVLSSKSRRSVLLARSRATHLAGSA